jgi:hypothetical protein
MAAKAPAQMIDSGRVMGRGFRVFGDNFVPFTILAILLVGLPAFGVQYLTVSALLQGQALTPDSPLYWVTLIVPWVLGALLQGILVRATVLDLADAEMELAQCTVTALGLVLPIAAISLLVFLGSMIGLLLLIVPGTMFYIAMIVAIPALIEERAGVLGSMKRSYRLTRGSWLQIFVLLVLYLIFAAVVWTVFGLAFGVSNFGVGFNHPVLAAGAQGFSSTFAAAIGAVMIASLYIELRSVKEGATTDDLASIFA